jgi:hypothetical protein
MTTYKDILCKNMNNKKNQVGKLDKNSPIYNLLLQKPLIENSRGLYRHNGVTHMVQFPTGDQILFGHLSLNNDIWLDFRIRGIKYSRSHNPYRSYTHLIK